MPTQIRFVRDLIFSLVLIFSFGAQAGTSAKSAKTNVKSAFPYKNTVSFKVHMAPELTPATALSVKLKTVDDVRDLDGTRIIQFTDGKIRIVPEGNPLLDLDPDIMKVFLQTYTTVFTDMQKLKNGSLIAAANGKHSDSLAVTLAEELGKSGMKGEDIEILDLEPMLDEYGIYDLVVDYNALLDASMMVEQAEQMYADMFAWASNSAEQTYNYGGGENYFWYTTTTYRDDGTSDTFIYFVEKISSGKTTATTIKTEKNENGEVTSEKIGKSTSEDDDDSWWEDFVDWLSGKEGDITAESEAGRVHFTNMLLGTMFNADAMKGIQPLVTSAYVNTKAKANFVTAANKVLKASATTLNTKLQNKARVAFTIKKIQ